jgi:hypothetical protein
MCRKIIFATMLPVVVLVFSFSFAKTTFGIPPAPPDIAYPSVYAVYIDGERLELQAILYNGQPLLSLRNVAYMLSGTESQFDVAWEEESRRPYQNNSVHIFRNTPYTVTGSEVTALTFTGETVMVDRFASTIYINGTRSHLRAYRTIPDFHGEYFINPRYLGVTLGFGVEVDDRRILIDTEPRIPIRTLSWMEDFTFTISIEDATILQGENFNISVTLENLSGLNLDLEGVEFYIDLPHWQRNAELDEASNVPTARFLSTGGEITETWSIGHTLEPGTRPFRVRVRFHIPGQRLFIWTEPVALTVARPREENEITVTIDGVPVNFFDQAPVIADGRTLVPVRGLFDNLGFYVRWNEDTRTVTLRRIVVIDGDSPDALVRFTEEVFITVGNDVFQYDSTLISAPVNHTLDVPAQIINGRTMLPIRAVLELMGYSVEWNAAAQTISITSSN